MPVQTRTALTTTHVTPMALFILAALLVLSTTAAPASGQQKLAPGEAVEGDIDTKGANEKYIFIAEGGETIAVTAGLVDPSKSDLYPHVTIIGPQGRELGSQYGKPGLSLTLRTKRSGTHAVVVADRYNQHTGRYRLIMHRAPAPGDANDRSTYLTNGRTHEAELAHGSMHLYRYEARAGDHLHVVMANTDEASKAHPSLLIIDPHGRPLEDGYGPTGGVARSVRAVHSGVYHVLAGERRSDEATAYRLTLAAAPGDEDAPAGDYKVLRYDQRVSSTLNAGEIDIYRFQGVPGVRVRLTVGHTGQASNTNALQVRFYDPHGWPVDQGSEKVFDTEALETEPLYAKPYHVVVYGDDGNASGDYQIALHAETPLPPDAITEPSAPTNEADRRASPNRDTTGPGSSDEQETDDDPEGPEINSVSEVVGSNDPQPFIIRGRGFHQAATVTLRDLRTGEPPFEDRPVTSRDAAGTRITINPTFTTAAARWSVQMINPGDIESDPYVFEVKAGDEDADRKTRFPAVDGDLSLRLPFSGGAEFEVTQSYLGDRGHSGYQVDFGMPDGTPVVAVASGRVVEVGDYAATSRDGKDPDTGLELTPHEKGGLYVKIRHRGTTQQWDSSYLHFEEIRVEKDDEVEAGQVIGLSGQTGYTTGPHLHFHIRDTDGQGHRPVPMHGRVSGSTDSRIDDFVEGRTYEATPSR